MSTRLGSCSTSCRRPPALRPRREQRKPPEDLRRSIAEQEPVKPSVRAPTGAGADALRTAQARGEASPASLAKRLRGEIDWIILKALEKDPERRYASVDELAADIDRWSNREPVVAGPPSRLYRLRKLAANRRAALAVGAALLLVLAAAAIQWHRAIAEHGRVDGATEVLWALSKTLDPAAEGLEEFLGEVSTRPSSRGVHFCRRCRPRGTARDEEAADRGISPHAGKRRSHDDRSRADGSQPRGAGVRL